VVDGDPLKVGESLAKTTGWIRRTLLRRRGVKMMSGVEYVKIDEAGLERRVGTAAGDFFKDPWPTGADTVFFSSILHDWSPETNRRLLRKAAKILLPGGLLIVRELFRDDDGPGPLQAAIGSVTMPTTRRPTAGHQLDGRS